MGKFVIKTKTNGHCYFNLKADNGEIILSSEVYTTRAACKNGINSVIAFATDESKYERKTSANGKYYFNLKASNGEIIGTSEMYQTFIGRDSGITSVKNNVSEVRIEEE